MASQQQQTSETKKRSCYECLIKVLQYGLSTTHLFLGNVLQSQTRIILTEERIVLEKIFLHFQHYNISLFIDYSRKCWMCCQYSFQSIVGGFPQHQQRFFIMFWRFAILHVLLHHFCSILLDNEKVFLSWLQCCQL